MISTSIVYIFSDKNITNKYIFLCSFFFNIRYMCTLFLFINVINYLGSHSVLVYKECPHFYFQLKIIHCAIIYLTDSLPAGH